VSPSRELRIYMDVYMYNTIVYTCIHTYSYLSQSLLLPTNLKVPVFRGTFPRHFLGTFLHPLQTQTSYSTHPTIPRHSLVLSCRVPVLSRRVASVSTSRAPFYSLFLLLSLFLPLFHSLMTGGNNVTRTSY